MSGRGVLRVIKGDATSPQAKGPKIIAHVCNDLGLGATQLVQVRPDTWVANMVAQRGTRTGSRGPPIRYDALASCLAVLADHAVRLEASVHMPRIGCGLAGGRWELVEPIIADTLLARSVPTTVYDH